MIRLVCLFDDFGLCFASGGIVLIVRGITCYFELEKKT